MTNENKQYKRFKLFRFTSHDKLKLEKEITEAELLKIAESFGYFEPDINGALFFLSAHASGYLRIEENAGALK